MFLDILLRLSNVLRDVNLLNWGYFLGLIEFNFVTIGKKNCIHVKLYLVLRVFIKVKRWIWLIEYF